MKTFFIIKTFLILLAGNAYCLNYEKESDKLVSEHIKFIKKNFKVYPAGVGGGMCGEINLISLHSDCYKIASVDDSREIFFDCVTDLLSRFNNCPKIRPYMHNYPFTLENLHIILAFRSPQGKRPSKDYVALVTVGQGKIFYSNYYSESESFGDLYEESIENAFKAYYSNKLVRK